MIIPLIGSLSTGYSSHHFVWLTLKHFQVILRAYFMNIYLFLRLKWIFLEQQSSELPGCSLACLNPSEWRKERMPKFETNILRKGIARPQTHFPHSCVCGRFIYSHDRSAYSVAGNMWTDPLGIYECIYKSLTDTWMWKLGLRPRKTQIRNISMGFSLQCV